MTVEIKLDVFEGPFDLLFHLIEKEEVNIYDIPIAKITEQYLSYINNMLSLDLEVASEFLVMAATLVAIKARMLLPKAPKATDEENFDEDPRTELVEKLLEYKKYKAASDYLRLQAGQSAQMLSRPDESEYFLSIFGEPELAQISLSQVTAAFVKILERLEKVPPIIRLKKRIITVNDRMDFIITKLRNYKTCTFEDLFDEAISRMEIVITFLAVLELMKLRRIIVQQDAHFSKIYLFERISEGEA